MKIRKDLEVSTMDFWYDINQGYIKPTLICENSEDADRVLGAVATLKEFENACEQKIEGFVQ